jgi:hypothetical protein
MVAKLCLKQGIYPLAFPYGQTHPDFSVKELDRATLPAEEELKEQFLEQQHNLGILLNDKLVDLDADWEEARKLIGILLLGKTWVFGRNMIKGDPSSFLYSHALYLCDEKFEKGCLKIIPPKSLVREGDKPAVIQAARQRCCDTG